MTDLHLLSAKRELFQRARRVVIAVLPGLLIVAQQSSIWGSIPIIILPILIIAIALLIAIDVRSSGRFELWHLPALGALFWEIRFFVLGLFGFHGGLIDLMLGTLLVVEIFLVLRLKKIHLPKLALLPIFLLLLAFVFESVASSNDWSTLLVLNILGWGLMVVPILIAGYLLSRGETADWGLFVVACEPVWLEMYLAPEGVSFDLWHSPVPTIQMAWLAIRIVPALGFLVVIPAIAIFIPDLRERNWWLIISSAMFVSAMVLIRTTILKDPGTEYVLPVAFMGTYFTLVSWLPVFLAVILYSSSDERKI